MKGTIFEHVKRSTKQISVIVISTALLTSCSAQPAGPSAEAAEVQLRTVKVQTLGKINTGGPAEQVGEAVASVTIDVVAKVGGDIQEILKKRGDNVNKGEVLFRIDPTDVLLQKEKARIALNGIQQQMAKSAEDVANSKKELQNAIAKLEISLKDEEKNYSKMRNDYDLGLVTKFQMEQLESALARIRLDIESNRNKLHTLENTNSLAQLEQSLQTTEVSIREADRTLSHMEVVTPISGMLTELPVEAGMTLPSGFVAAQVQQLDPIKVKADLTEYTARSLQGKQELSLYVPGTEDRWQGTVSYLSAVKSTKSQSYPLELEVANAGQKLKPGTKVQIILTGDSDQAVVAAPATSIIHENGDTFVFVLVGDQAEKRKVELGRPINNMQEIIAGVKEGEQLIVSGQNLLTDKEKVSVAQ